MEIEAKVTLDADEIRKLAEIEAQSKYPAPAGMRWVASAAYSYIPDVQVKLYSDKESDDYVEPAAAEPQTEKEAEVEF